MERSFDLLRCCAVSSSLSGWLVLMLGALMLWGCSREQPAIAPIKRAVKIEAVTPLNGRDAVFTGTVRQRQRAELAFESAGQMVELFVEVGDTVRAGQVLASLDLQPARLRLQQARARLDASRSQAVERASNLVRQQRLFAAGSVSQGVLEQASESDAQAQAERRRAQADLALAQRELERSQLMAPFSGRVVSRRADRYAQLGAGQVVLEVESAGDQQVVASLPVDQAAGLKPGDSASAYRADSPDKPFALVLEGVSPRASNGLTQLCIFKVRDPSTAIPSDLTVLVHLQQPTPPVLSIPERALWVGVDKPYVYVYLPTEQKVFRRPVSIQRVEEGRALLESGLQRGEWVVTAGASFITDGQSVSIFQPTTRLIGN
ncbi:efflux RND transporter periplasmic adaptor subunit [Pseudomonas asplenii]|uniref:efflux RND transporter periplasmic adaptor subunit n=1 Tax=Pseudomonas asplenii TaxID=53407 RepID=UPI00235F8AD0|nr:efflux RND transporter periplasmic adaptor subunit [Pseudomonas asplenii]